ncbi:hypothetical protein ACFL02_05650, partial [Planctomycetota bacterium]
NEIDPAQVQLSEIALGAEYSDIVGLVELDGALYGLNAPPPGPGSVPQLIWFDSDPNSVNFGSVSGSLALTTGAGEDLLIEELKITGLDVDLEGEGLLMLHDQDEDVHTSFMVDALYRLDQYTGAVSLLEEFLFDEDRIWQERHGLATEPGGAIFVGLPLRSSPLGETLDISFELGNFTLGTQSHEFGSVASVFPGEDNRVSSYVLEVPENSRALDFVEAGFHYVFDITYDTGAAYGDITVTISEFDWLNEDVFGMISLATDDPDNVIATLLPVISVTGEVDYDIELLIDAVNGEGEVKLYFARSSELEVLEPSELAVGGPLLGESNRSDLTPTRDFILPDLDAITTNTSILQSAWDLEVELTAGLIAELELVLSAELADQLGGELTAELITEILDELILLGEIELLDEVLNAISSVRLIEYNALGYDVEQEIFALISTTTYDAAPIMVEHPFDSTADDVPLTRQVLSDIYDQRIPGKIITFENIWGFEFGNLSKLYVVVTVSERLVGEPESASVTRDSLLMIEDILDPSTGMTLSPNPLSITVDDAMHDLQITSLAFDNGTDWDQIDNKLYGIDPTTQTLLIIETRETLPGPDGLPQPNDRFGMLSLPGGGLGNLGNPGGSAFAISEIDFDLEGRLYGLETNTSSLVQISTESFSNPNSERVDLVMRLPEGEEFQGLTFDVLHQVVLPPGFLPTPEVSFFLIQSVSGSPLEDEMQLRVTVEGSGNNSSDWEDHTFGGSEVNEIDLSSDIPDSDKTGIVSISSVDINSESVVSDEGGYYRFLVTYPQNQGDILLNIADIDWLTGSGEVDVVFVGDVISTTVETFNEDALSVRINSDIGDGEAVIYFGSTSELLFASTTQSLTNQVAPQAWQGAYQIPLILPYLYNPVSGTKWVIPIPEDGNYALQIKGSGPSAYEVSIMTFNDGNSDFGVLQTESGYRYYPTYPNDRPVNLMPIEWGNDDLEPDTDDAELFFYNTGQNDADPVKNSRLAWPIRVTGTLPAPGESGEVTIDTALSNVMDVDIYSFDLVEGQCLTVDIEANSQLGWEDVNLSVGVYNGDLELLATVVMYQDDTLEPSQRVDPFYTVQAIHQMPNHEGALDPIIDPMNYDSSLDAMVGTYYVVVTLGIPTDLHDSIDYQLTITTTEPEAVEAPPSQLVWLAFGDPETGANAQADHLGEQLAERGPAYSDVGDRPAFDPEAFRLEDVDFDVLIQVIADRVEQIYRNAGLSEDEIEFTTIKPGAPGSSYGADAVYSKVILGGKIPSLSLGLAESVDRHNSDRTDTAVVLTDDIGINNYQEYDDDPSVRFNQVVNSVANIAAHELGHILGLQHATEVDTSTPANIMGYNYDMELEQQEFKERTSLIDFANQQGFPEIQPGLTNEIDMLLRTLGSGTIMGQ